jgi:hypothetical protein
LRQFERGELKKGERIGETHKRNKLFDINICPSQILRYEHTPLLVVWIIRVYLESKTFVGDYLWVKSRMIEQQLALSRKKDKFLDIKKKVSFPFGKFAPSELYQGKWYLT